MANVKLSTAELELVSNPHIILTKNSIIKKVYDLFGELSTAYYKRINESNLPEKIKLVNPKISRGENYEGLPWVMLDFPRCFSSENIFAIRTFFWWGNFFSITLHLKGEYLPLLKIDVLKKTFATWYLCKNSDEWQHHFRMDNYELIENFSENQITNLSFIKLAKKIPLTQWDDVENILKQHFNMLLLSIKLTA